MNRSAVAVLLVVLLPGMALSAVAAQAPEAVRKSHKAIGYEVGGGSTEIDLKIGTL